MTIFGAKRLCIIAGFSRGLDGIFQFTNLIHNLTTWSKNMLADVALKAPAEDWNELLKSGFCPNLWLGLGLNGGANDNKPPERKHPSDTFTERTLFSANVVKIKSHLMEGESYHGWVFMDFLLDWRLGPVGNCADVWLGNTGF